MFFKILTGIKIKMISTLVSVIGGGPVGLYGCLLLQKFGIDYVCLQKSQKLRSHPSAHWVSARSKQILSQINGLSERIDYQQQSFQHFKYYRYCQSIGGRQFGRSNHFLPTIQQKLNTSFKYFGQYPNHISQSKLLNLEYQFLQQKKNVIFDQQITDIKKSNQEYLLINSKKEVVAKSKYVILSNGFNSKLRNQIGIQVGGGKQFYKLINIHFKSLKLAKIIKENHVEAMLHFIYNDKLPCVLVNHSLNQGQFVLQIPNYEPFIDLLQVYSALQLIKTSIANKYYGEIVSDIKIINVGRWKLQAQIAQKMFQQNIFLAGDTAHTYTPAGGFGMNCGFQDINQLIHTLHLLQRNTKVDTDKLRNMYNTDRINTNTKYLEKSLRNYQLTDQIANQLGFPSQLTEYYFSFCRFMPQFSLSFGMKLTENIRLLAMKNLFKPKALKPQLDLFFDQFDYNVQKQSKILPKIIQSFKRNKYHDVWIDKSVDIGEVYEIFGQVKQQNIYKTDLPNGQKIVRRDGIIMK